MGARVGISERCLCGGDGGAGDRGGAGPGGDVGGGAGDRGDGGPGEAARGGRSFRMISRREVRVTSNLVAMLPILCK